LYRCSKNECIDGVKHKVVEYEEELVNTAKTKLDKWKKDKIRDIDFLSNQVEIFPSQIFNQCNIKTNGNKRNQ